MLPPPVVDDWNGVMVVRDDLLPGGTKRRALSAFVDRMDSLDFVYASPAQGYAQLALAYACRDLNRRATIFTAKRKVMAPLTAEAAKLGAKIVMVPTGYLSNVKAKARAYCEATGATLVPFGIDHPVFIDTLAEVARQINVKPSQVWAAAGSGVLIRSLQKAWPSSDFIAVQIGKTPNVGRARLIVADEAFEQPAKKPPSFPSCSYYDAKAWRYVKRYASKGALFWNVAA